MRIHLAQIPEEGMPLEGELPGELVKVPEFEPTGPVRYSVEVTYQDHNLLVLGVVRVAGRTPCVRCLQTMDMEIVVPEFTVLVEQPKEECVDLTDRVREDILLALPAYSRCVLDARQHCPITGEDWGKLSEDVPKEALGNPWSVLDELKLK
jgi:uncharacterized protein